MPNNQYDFLDQDRFRRRAQDLADVNSMRDYENQLAALNAPPPVPDEATAMANYGRHLDAIGTPGALSQGAAIGPMPPPPKPAIVAAIAARRKPATAIAPPVPQPTPQAAAEEPEEDTTADRIASRKAELDAATGLRDKRQAGANLFEGLGQIAQGASGAQGAYDGSFYGKLRDQAGEGVTDVTTKQKLAGEELTQADKERDLGRKTALGNAKSVESSVARAVGRRRLQESGADPKMITDGMSALDVADLEKSITGLEGAATRKQVSADTRAGHELMARLSAGARQEAAAARADQAKGPQFQAGGFGKRIENAMGVMDNLAGTGYDRSSNASSLRSGLPNIAMSTEGQQQEQAERDFVNAVLRRESGAAIAKSEFDSAEKQYFPRAGDAPEVLKQKRINRQQVLNSLKAEAGPAWHKIPSAGGAGSPGSATGNGEVLRKTQDGRVAVFDAATKSFLRYQE